MDSDITIALGFAKNIIKCIELKDRKGLKMIQRQLIGKVYNKENNVKLAHSSLIPIKNYEIMNELEPEL